MLSIEEVRSFLESAGQCHILQFWNELSESEKIAFLSELSQLDFHELREHCEGAARAMRSPSSKVDQQMKPLPSDFVGSIRRSDKNSLLDWENEGFFQISQSRVAVLLLAGGQGTRLGVPYPKGMYNVGLPSGKSLYQIQAERIYKVQQLADVKHGTKCTVPWYIMTSEFTLNPTNIFFKENDYFGLDPSNISMFEQRMIPAVTFDGKVILENKGKIAMAPDGNGGLYRALVDNKILEDMEMRGVEYLHIYCVDNILVKMADPTFIGFCVCKGAECGAKVVEKAYPAEPVGVVCMVNDVYQVVEYSEVQPATAELRNPGGELLYGMGNICNHFFTQAFLKDVVQKCEGQIKQHVALKKVPFVDKDGNLVKPSTPNGIKMEKFVFDVFEFSRNFVAFEVLRDEEFSPLKNSDEAAVDNPTTARDSVLAQHYHWAVASGAIFIGDHGKPLPSNLKETSLGNPPAVCEISPLVSYFGEGLEPLLKDRVLTTSLLLDEKKAAEMMSC